MLGYDIIDGGRVQKAKKVLTEKSPVQFAMNPLNWSISIHLQYVWTKVRYIYIHISLYIYTHISIYIYIYIYICIGSRSFSEGFLRKPHHVRPEMSAAENREGMHHLPTVSFLHDIYCIYRHVYTHKVWIHTYPQ